jgi:hypothetical protein
MGQRVKRALCKRPIAVQAWARTGQKQISGCFRTIGTPSWRQLGREARKHYPYPEDLMLAGVADVQGLGGRSGR